MKTNDERFEEWWAENRAHVQDRYSHCSMEIEDFARAAVNALCLSDEDREEER